VAIKCWKGDGVHEGDERPEPEAVEPPPREPAVRAPLPALGLTLALIGLYALQGLAGDPQSVAGRFGFSPAAFAAGDWAGLITALFVHGSWTHVLMNAGWGLAFGAPVARFFGKGAAGAALFLFFFLVCGVGASLGFAALHPGAHVALIGASGAVSGLMGAASRLIENGDRLAPFASRTVIGMAALWLIVNLLIAVAGLGVVSGDVPIAWEAHLAGYAVGLVLIGPAARLLRRPFTKL
jgi:membrane associated rhomboid family serine protease